MIVRNIIDTKATSKIVTIAPTETVRSAVELLASHRIGAVIVSSDGDIVDGILSERDIVRAIGTRGVATLEMKVQDLMTSTVVGCRPDDTAMSVMERMTDGRFRHMPVIDQNKMGGVISIGGVVKARITAPLDRGRAIMLLSRRRRAARGGAGCGSGSILAPSTRSPSATPTSSGAPA
jgi:CBS domain-containing protein